MFTVLVLAGSLLCAQPEEDLPSLLRKHQSLTKERDKHDLMLTILARFGKQMASNEFFITSGETLNYYTELGDDRRLERILTLVIEGHDRISGPRGVQYVYLDQLAGCQYRLEAFDRFESTMERLLPIELAHLSAAKNIQQYIRYLYSRQRVADGDRVLAKMVTQEVKAAGDGAFDDFNPVPHMLWKYRMMQASIALGRGKVQEARATLAAYGAYEAKARERMEVASKNKSAEERAFLGLMQLSLEGPLVDQDPKMLSIVLEVADGKFTEAIARAETSFRDAWRLPPSLNNMVVPIGTVLASAPHRYSDQLTTSLLSRIPQFDESTATRLAGLLISKKGAIAHVASLGLQLPPGQSPSDRTGPVDFLPENAFEAMTIKERSNLLHLVRRHIGTELVGGDEDLSRLLKLLVYVESIESAGNVRAMSDRFNLRDMLNVSSAARLFDAKALREKLSPREIYIDFQRRTPTAFDDKLAAGDHYYAIVIQRDSAVSIHDLGPTSQVDDDIGLLQRLMYEAPKTIGTIGEAAAEKQVREPAARLAAKLFGPIQKSLATGTSLLISPDSLLWNLPWAALVREDGSYFAEHHRISLVPSPQSLMVEQRAAAIQTAAVFANPDYGKANSPAPAEPQGFLTRGSRSRLKLGNIVQLPTADLEGESVRTTLEEKLKIRVQHTTGPDATVQKITELKDVGLIHFVTHGFSFGAPSNRTEPIARLYQSHPSLAFAGTGLLMAGCNLPRTEGHLQEGLLTGLQILNMNLKSTHLVMLSGCETGLGQPTDGEGVIGLAKAFHLAGTRNVVSTLWQIPDRASTLLTADFYKNLDLDRIDESLRTAQRNQIIQRRDRFGAAHPFFWASYILTR